MIFRFLVGSPPSPLPMQWARRCGTAAALLLLAALPAQAETLSVGPDKTFKLPSEAIAAAHDGDTIEIAAGEYFDCAIIHQSHLTIAGAGPDTVLTDKTCESKALLITRGSDTTIRDLTLTRARVADGNGGGIRAEGPGLTVQRVRFINNEVGVLAGDFPTGAVRILDSLFDRNGRCDTSCVHSVFIGRAALLHIEGTKFTETRGGHHIKSAALRTELIGNDIEDGPNGTASYLVEIPNGGALVMRDNTLEKGPRSTNLRAAVMVGDDDRSQPTAELTFRHNTFINDTGSSVPFVLNWSETDATFDGNTFKGDVTATSSKGYLLHRVREGLIDMKSGVRDVARAIKHVVMPAH